MLTLWDIIPRRRRAAPPPDPRPLAPHAPKTRPNSRGRLPNAPAKPRVGPRPGGAAARYERMTRELLETHGVRVRKWRTSMSGVAWEVTYRDGSVTRLIEAPRPKGPMSAAIFLHEIGHHAIGFHRYRPRCLEEYHAWAWALAEMERQGLNITDRVRARMHESLHYAVAKAARRGLKQLPSELLPYLERPKTRPRRRPAE